MTVAGIAGNFKALIARFLLASAFCWPALAAVAEQPPSREYRIKAAYLYNLGKFISWPPSERRATTVDICVLGPNVFGDYLKKLEQQTVKSRAIRVYHYTKPIETGQCHIAFISSADPAATAIFIRSAPPAVLTVGEGSEFLDRGGVIGMVRVEDTVQLEINLSLAREHGFEFSADLLEIARDIR